MPGPNQGLGKERRPGRRLSPGPERTELPRAPRAAGGRDPRPQCAGPALLTGRTRPPGRTTSPNTVPLGPAAAPPSGGAGCQAARALPAAALSAPPAAPRPAPPQPPPRASPRLAPLPAPASCAVGRSAVPGPGGRATYPPRWGLRSGRRHCLRTGGGGDGAPGGPASPPRQLWGGSHSLPADPGPKVAQQPTEPRPRVPPSPPPSPTRRPPPRGLPAEENPDSNPAPCRPPAGVQRRQSNN
ncbi:basic proline-rich protein-like [Vulpes lagopus]|uniref:basic proline-rich protein-like n=1 Tax=Vulpes lagopus TaxID=494514 RepID=UPI001BC9AFE1|nr:basic proline-rich protein-like [Vulpes lagopus]